MNSFDEELHDFERRVLGDEPRRDPFLDQGFPKAIQGSAETLHVSPGFAEGCLRAVMDDRRRIDAEAAKVEDIQFPKELLAAYDLPASDPTFVDRVHQRVVTDRVAQRNQWRGLLRSYGIPEPSADFVLRTLAALCAADALAPAAQKSPTGPGSWRRRAAAAAAAILLAVGLNVSVTGLSLFLSTTPNQEAVSAQDTSPVPWGTALERQRNEALRFEAVDALQVFSIAQRAEDD